MNISRYLMVAWVFFALCLACKPNPLDTDQAKTPNAFPIGKPTGGETVFTITPTGGEYALPDKSLKLIFPAGALSTATKITI